MAKFGIERMAADIARMIASEATPWLDHHVKSGTFGSPIEALFYCAVDWHVRCFGLSEYAFDRLLLRPIDGENDALIMEKQAVVIDWPVDFLIYPVIAPESAIVVECDGHEYHERTKEQAARDRSRDRALQERGFVVFRFTGSEIYRDPLKCARQVLSAATKSFWSKSLARKD